MVASCSWYRGSSTFLWYCRSAANTCSVAGDSERNSDFAAWEVVADSGGEYELRFRNGAAHGFSVRMATIALSCAAGTHALGGILMH